MRLDWTGHNGPGKMVRSDQCATARCVLVADLSLRSGTGGTMST